MPMARKSINTGTPNLEVVFPAKSEMKRRIDPTSNIFSVERFI